MRKFEVVIDSAIKYNVKNIKMPKRATKYSAGYDLYSPIDVTIMPGTAEMIWTNLKVQMNIEDARKSKVITDGLYLHLSELQNQYPNNLKLERGVEHRHDGCQGDLAVAGHVLDEEDVFGHDDFLSAKTCPEIIA